MALYFLRHGESQSNEQNLFAGRVDTPLTELGRCQAGQAQVLIARQGLHFDEVHTSSLSRARDTASIILQGVAGATPKMIVCDDLIERDFGLLSEQNKSLIKKHYGAAGYESMFHSSTGAPPLGESFHAMYERVRLYYENVLRPQSESGKTILVVAHKYIVEMFALIAADLKPEQYHDFKIPNSKPCSWAELRDRALGASAHLNAMAEEFEARLPQWLLAAAGLGVIAKLIVGVDLNATLFTALTILILAFNSWISLLRLETRYFVQAPLSLRKIWKGALLRTGLGVTLLLIGSSPWVRAAGTFLLLPPAMTASTLSLMWGGNYFLSMQSTLVLSVASPLVLGLLTWLGGPSHVTEMANLRLFFLILTLSVVVPGILAQIYRARKPIESGAITTNWGWLGGVSMMPLALLAAYQFTGRPGPELWGSRLLINLLCAGALFIGIRLIGAISARLTRGNAGLKLDVYISHIAPNIFFWFSLLPNSPGFTEVRWITTALFFVSIYFEERRFVSAFPKLISARALKVSGRCTETSRPDPYSNRVEYA